jgi:hypothetical protein
MVDVPNEADAGCGQSGELRGVLVGENGVADGWVLLHLPALIIAQWAWLE